MRKSTVRKVAKAVVGGALFGGAAKALEASASLVRKTKQLDPNSAVRGAEMGAIGKKAMPKFAKMSDSKPFPKLPKVMPKNLPAKMNDRKPPVQGGPSGISTPMPNLQGSSPVLQGSTVDPMKMRKPRKVKPTRLMKYL